ncbi:hypothetical protein ILUMI_20142 [Ignelater luminosus]|uniref:Uncharacterized protein n=1 Tax=Ignelater luminosus TaxID=2038154 RepID=A0A8K0CJ20_IGNLU|nr:hypothetical protein ILUMI_20142 [Ignelater luminosus]
MLGTVFPHAFSTKNIVSGFKAAEIFPLDWNLFTDDDLCSSVTDRTMLENGISFPVSNSNECLNKTFSDPQPSTSSHDSMPEEASVCICSAEVNNHAEINKLPVHNNLSPSDSVGFHGQRIVTPKNVQPYPKSNKRGRKPSTIFIPADTSKKERIHQVKETDGKNKLLKLQERKRCRKIYSDTKTSKLSRFEKKVGEGHPAKLRKINQVNQRKRDISSSSSEDSIVSLVDTNDEDSADEECIFCHQLYNQDRSGE